MSIANDSLGPAADGTSVLLRAAPPSGSSQEASDAPQFESRPTSTKSLQVPPGQGGSPKKVPSPLHDQVTASASESFDAACTAVVRNAGKMTGDDGEASVHNELDNNAAQEISSSSGAAEDADDNASFIATPPRTESIFTARQRELHFLSDQFRQDYQSWFQDDDTDDDTDNESHAPDAAAGDRAEFTGSTNFVKRRGSYCLSHEKGALHFAQSLDIDDEDDEEDPSMASQ